MPLLQPRAGFNRRSSIARGRVAACPPDFVPPAAHREMTLDGYRLLQRMLVLQCSSTAAARAGPSGTDARHRRRTCHVPVTTAAPHIAAPTRSESGPKISQTFVIGNEAHPFLFGNDL
ncbi:hypothetical protein [Burkholderia sp. PU8-34]